MDVQLYIKQLEVGTGRIYFNCKCFLNDFFYNYFVMMICPFPPYGDESYLVEKHWFIGRMIRQLIIHDNYKDYLENETGYFCLCWIVLSRIILGQIRPGHGPPVNNPLYNKPPTMRLPCRKPLMNNPSVNYRRIFSPGG